MNDPQNKPHSRDSATPSPTHADLSDLLSPKRRTESAEQKGNASPHLNATVPTPSATPPSRARQSGDTAARMRAFPAVALVVALAAGITLGVLGADRVRHWLGFSSPHANSDAGTARQLWTCGMHPQVIQDKPGNCPICGMALEPLKTDPTTSMTQVSTERKIKYWWDPMMNPPYISDKPGKSPMGMDLVPVYADEVSGGAAITIDPAVVQNMGVRVVQIGQGPIRRAIRAVGYLEQAQPRIHDVNLRVSGWVEMLHADTDGMTITKGQPLFELYSPEVQVAVEELITAQQAVEELPADTDDTARKTADVLAGAARRKLEQWGLEPSQIDELAKLDRAPRTITFLSPITGEVSEKMVVQGAMVKMGERALRLVDRSVLWLDAQVHAQDLAFIKIGQKVDAVIESIPGRQFQGEIIFVHPQVDPMTRTAKVRMVLDNQQLTLRPGMFATAIVTAQLSDNALLVPREAILDTGTRQVVFVSLDKGHFEPRKIKTGLASNDGSVQVLSGLAAGETVVTSGQFLMDAESRMKEAIQKHLNDKLLSSMPTSAAEHQGHAPSKKPSTDMHQGHGQAGAATAPIIAGSAEWRSAVDAVVTEYLRISSALGSVQKENTPMALGGLRQAGMMLARYADTQIQKSLAQSVQRTIEPLVDQPLDKQREAFRQLNDAVIAMIDASPPSQDVATRLFVYYCPMAKGQWLQASAEMANPYYATHMKQCGEVKRTINAVK